MVEIFQVTAEYSNAVLVAILPFVADFAKRLELPVPQPITMAQVQRFGCSPRSDHVGGRVVLTNGHSFSFDRGRVMLYRSPRSYFSLQDPDRVPEFYGGVKLSPEEALQIARRAISKLGYTHAMVDADRPPEMTAPPTNGTNVVPRYRVRWLKKDASADRSPGTSVDLEVDASTGQIQMIGILSTNSWQPNPKIAVRPPVVAKGPETTYRGGREVHPVSPEYARSLLAAILPQLSEYVRVAGFEVKVPITANDVDMARYDCGLVEGDPRVFLYLKTGERFVYSHGQVISFEAADAIRLPENKEKPSREFYGRVNLTATDAIGLVTGTVSRLGYSLKLLGLDMPPEVASPRREGTNFVARYFLTWRNRDRDLFLAVAEVDATTEKLKALYINDRINTNIWRVPPRTVAPGETRVDYE